MRQLAFVLVVICSALLFAQPGPSGPSGPPETILAGINTRTNSIADVQKLYGQQQGMFAVNSGGYPEGTKLYKWSRLTVTLKVLTEPSTAGEAIRAIQVEGEGEPGKKPINRTGQGLSLGDKAGKIKEVYDTEPVNGSATVNWPDGTSLIIGLNDKGRVSKLELRAPRSTAP